MDVTTLQSAAGAVETAISLDRGKLKWEAASKYMEAVGTYVVALQGSQGLNDEQRTFIYRNISEYVQRAQELLKEDEESNIDSHKTPDIKYEVQKNDYGGGNSNMDNEVASQLETAIVITRPNVGWDKVIGLESAKTPMQETILLPILFPNSPQAEYGHKGLLLFGPGGVGKTKLCKVLATDAGDATFINVRPDLFLSKWVGESEKQVRGLFTMAREKRPSIVFIDEVDSFCGARDEESDSSRRFKNAILCEMDGMEDMRGVFIIGATNQPYSIDPSFLRRFPRRVYVPLPDVRSREEIIRKKLVHYKYALSTADISHVAGKTDGFSGSDIATLVTEAGLEPFRDFMAGEKVKQRKKAVRRLGPSNDEFRPINVNNFKLALKKCCAANAPSMIRKLEDWNREHGDNSHATENHFISKPPGFFRTFFEVFGFPL